MTVTSLSRAAVFLAALALPAGAYASGAGAAMEIPDLTATSLGIAALLGFVLAYVFVIAEEFTNLRKSKAVVVMAGVIWILVAISYARAGVPGATDLLKMQIEEYAELLLFLLAAMTYVNTLQ